MRLSKVAKELNVGIANIVDHLASKGVNIDGRPNTKITQDAYQILKQQFSADVEQHKRSTEVAQARREEKQAIKDAAINKIEQKTEVVKANANVVKPKMVGKIDVSPKPKIVPKEKSVKPVEETLDAKTNPEKEVGVDEKNLSEVTKVVPASNVKKEQVIKAKGATSLSGPKHVGKIDVNKPIEVSEPESTVNPKSSEKPEAQDEQEVLRAKSKTISGPKLTGQVIDLEQFKKPKKKVASSR
jgi:translation initiation factor IF-2